MQTGCRTKIGDSRAQQRSQYLLWQEAQKKKEQKDDKDKDTPEENEKEEVAKCPMEEEEEEVECILYAENAEGYQEQAMALRIEGLPKTNAIKEAMR